MSRIKFGNYEPELEMINTDMYNRPAMQHIYFFCKRVRSKCNSE